MTWENNPSFLQKGTVDPKCKLGTCNPVNFTVFNPGDSRWEEGHQISVYVNGRGPDPGTALLSRAFLLLSGFPHTGSSTLFMKRLKVVLFLLQPKLKMSLALAETIAQILMVTSCYVCGGTNMGDQLPGEAKELDN